MALPCSENTTMLIPGKPLCEFYNQSITTEKYSLFEDLLFTRIGEDTQDETLKMTEQFGQWHVGEHDPLGNIPPNY